MKHSLFFIIFTLLAVYFINGCDDDIVKKGGGNNNNTDTSILYTDQFGNILGGDTTDWCLNNQGGFTFGPAYPNPGYPSIRVKFAVPQQDTVKIYFLNSSSDSTVFFNRPVMPGFYEVSITDSTGAWLDKVKRIYIQSKQQSSSQYCRFYGDIRFSQ